MNISGIESAYNHCKKIALGHYENFPVGSLIVPSNKRMYIYAIYAFARMADDIADSNDLQTETKLESLERLRNCVENIYDNEVADSEINDPVFIALRDTVRSLNIDKREFLDLLSAFVQDAKGFDYKTFEMLTDYSSRSANPIGHLVLNVFGYKVEDQKKMFELSDKICTALQLTNFWQDVSEDLKIDRIYIPADLMNTHGYTTEDLKNKVEDERFRKIIKSLCDRTSCLFDEGEELAEYVHGRLKMEIKATVFGGRKILSKIKECDYSVLSRRPKLSKFEKAELLFKALI